MRSCRQHHDRPSSSSCCGCGAPFCDECLVPILGRTWCAECKLTAVGGRPAAVTRTERCGDAGKALGMAIGSFFCFGIVLGPIAIKKGLDVMSTCKTSPRLTGWGRGLAAVVLGSIGVGLWVLGIVARAME